MANKNMFYVYLAVMHVASHYHSEEDKPEEKFKLEGSQLEVVKQLMRLAGIDVENITWVKALSYSSVNGSVHRVFFDVGQVDPDDNRLDVQELAIAFTGQQNWPEQVWIEFAGDTYAVTE